MGSQEHHENELHTDDHDALLQVLRKVIHWSVRVLAVLMAAVIVWGVLDVFYVLIQRLMTPPYLLLEITDILATFGAFMAVLIAIEIFVNITIYLREDVIHVKIVLATALMAIARKVIILDFKQTEALHVFGIAAVVLAMSIAYWLVAVKDKAPPIPKLSGKIEGSSLRESAPE
jgi:uncharacterized membrane protein (DUF373 family)